MTFDDCYDASQVSGSPTQTVGSGSACLPVWSYVRSTAFSIQPRYLLSMLNFNWKTTDSPKLDSFE